MLRRIFIYTILTLVVIFLLVFFVRAIRGDSKPADNGMVLFYSKVCPHCMKVDGFINSTPAMSKLNLVHKQVDQHISEVMAIAKYCRLDSQRLQIPLLWTGKVCITGDTPIIQYFKQQLGKK